MVEMGWCWEKFEQCIHGVGDDGCSVVYHYREPPHNPDAFAATRIYFCRGAAASCQTGQKHRIPPEAPMLLRRSLR